MKKIVLIMVLVLTIGGTVFAQTQQNGMLDIKVYSKLFLNANGLISRTYLRAANDENELNKIAALSGDHKALDTPIEIAVLSTCAGVADIRPAEAAAMLGTPQQADLKLGAAVLQEIQVLRFLGDTAAAGRHEGVLKFITDRGNATRAEVEAFYRQGIGVLVAETVDAEFNRVSFTFDSTDTNGKSSYGAVLIRNPKDGKYTLSYTKLCLNLMEK